MSQATGKLALVEQEYVELKKNFPDFGPGDSLRVHVRIKEGEKERIQIFEGTVIAIQNTGSRKSFVIRKLAHGVGVERVFPFASPSLAKIERTMIGRVRRAKIYYIRGLQGKAAAIQTDTR